MFSSSFSFSIQILSFSWMRCQIQLFSVIGCMMSTQWTKHWQGICLTLVLGSSSLINLWHCLCQLDCLRVSDLLSSMTLVLICHVDCLLIMTFSTVWLLSSYLDLVIEWTVSLAGPSPVWLLFSSDLPRVGPEPHGSPQFFALILNKVSVEHLSAFGSFQKIWHHTLVRYGPRGRITSAICNESSRSQAQPPWRWTLQHPDSPWMLWQREPTTFRANSQWIQLSDQKPAMPVPSAVAHE